MILILLATYNGQQHLGELLESIRAQSFSDWQMLIRDDGSTDQTPEILRQAVAADDRIRLLADEKGRRGAGGNFALLLEAARELGAEYVFLADQDDVWLPSKIEKLLHVIKQAEAQKGRQPLLVHSDLTVVDGDLREIHPSFARYARLARDEREPLRALLAYNSVTGCASLVNRPLLEVAVPVPSAALMHDWWLALCAATWGEIRYLAEPLVLYRQHGRNSVGARGFWPSLLFPREAARRWCRSMANFQASIEQARQLRSRMQERQPREAAPSELVDGYCRLFSPGRSRLERLAGVRGLAIARCDPLRRLALAARVLALPPRQQP